MLDFYQNIPQFLDPIAFSIGFFSIRWYALMYLIGFTFSLAVIFWRILKVEDGYITGLTRNKDKYDFFLDFFLIGLIGGLLGGRIWYAIFYSPVFFFENPLALVWPFDIGSGAYIGISGMSYFGALAGILVSSWIFLKVKRADFWRIGDFVVPVLAGAYFFGRIGNFINGELWGRKTEFIFGMHFASDNFLRHPSQLYEAFFEGILIFVLLWIFRNKAKFEGQILISYLILYSSMRFFLEFLREPGAGEILFSGFLTKGQFLSIITLFIAVALYFQKSRKML